MLSFLVKKTEAFLLRKLKFLETIDVDMKDAISVDAH